MKRTEKKEKGRFFTATNMFYAVLVLIALLMGHMVVSKHQNVRFFDSGELKSFSENWTLTCSSGVYEVTLPVNGEYENTDETVRLTNVLPDPLGTGTVLMTRSSLQSISVYIGEDEVYSYGRQYEPPLGKSNGSIWNIIYLPEDSAGKTVTLVITSPYKTYRKIFNDVYFGTFRGAMGFLFHEYGLSLVLIIIELLVSIILFIMYFVMKIWNVPVSKKLICAAGIGFFSSCWLFTECKLTQVFVANMAGFSGASFVFLAVVMIPPLFYVDELEKQASHKYIARAIILLEINAAAQITLQSLQLVDFYEMMFVTHALMGLSVFVAIVSAVHRYITYGGKEIKILLIVTAFMTICVGVEMLITLLTGYVSGGILETCVLITLILAIGDSLNDTIKMVQESRRALSESTAKNYFFDKISQDISNPIDAICTMADLMEKSNELSQNNMDAVRSISASADSLSEIIHELVDYSKLSSNELELVENSYAIGDAVEKVRNTIGVKAAEKGLDFEMSISPDLPIKLRGDYQRVAQLLTVLLTNAINHTITGHISLKLTGTRIPGGFIKLYIVIRDTGRGIREEERDNLFEPFYRVEEDDGTKDIGTGLGLAVAKQLSNLMGGNITVESEFGVGSTFSATIIQNIDSDETFRSIFAEAGGRNNLKKIYVAEGDYGFTGNVRAVLNEATIPYEMIKRGMLDGYEFERVTGVLLLNSSDYKKYITDAFVKRNPGIEPVVVAGSIEQITAMRNAEILRAPLTVCDLVKICNGDRANREKVFFDAGAASVMVVDDNVVNLKVMSAALKRFGIKPTLISNGMQAIDAVKTKQYDIIFMDHMMPEMDGIETASRIRNLNTEGTDRIKIVALTANASLDIEKMFKEKGFDGFLSKPVSVEKLAKMLRDQLPAEKCGK